MPRIYKGSENTLKLLVHTCDPDTIDNLKIVLFTDDPNSAAEFYSDSITIEGNIASLKVNAWSFDNMNEGVINYIASGELGNDTFLTERQSNYYLKSPNNYTPTTPDFDDYYTKTEVDDMLNDIEVDVDLEGYATEQWVRQQGYVTDSDVNDYVGNEIGQLEEIINTKQDELVSGTNIKTINGNDILGEGDITIEGGGSAYNFYSIVDRRMTDDEWYEIYNNNQEGIASYIFYKLYDTTAQGFATFGFYEGYFSIVITTAQEQVIWRQGDVSGTEAWHKVVSLNSGSGGDAGTYILECVQPVQTREWWFNPETGEEEIIVEGNYEEYNNSEERKAHNKEIIDAILAGECKTLYYKFLYHITEEVLETDENGREHRKLVNYYNYIPMSWNEWDLIDGEEYITFSGKHRQDLLSFPIEYSFNLNKATGENIRGMENSYFMGNVIDYYTVDYGNDYLLTRYIASTAASATKPMYIDIIGKYGVARTTLSGKYEVRNDKEYLYAWCIDEKANFYLWYFKGSDVQEATPTITDLKTTPVDLTPYYTKKEIDKLLADLDLSDYYTKAETDELIANINLGDSSTISSIVSTEVSNQLTDNFKTINGESIIGEGDIVIEAGTDVELTDYYTKKETDKAISEGKRIGILECVEELYDFKNDTYLSYADDGRMSHNATVIQNALNGAYDIVVYKHFYEQANSQNIFIYVPLNFRYPSHDGYFRATGLLETIEYTGSSSAKLIHMLMYSDGSVGSFGADNVNLLSSGGGSSSGVPDASTINWPTLVSPTVSGEMQFQESYGTYADTANGIACGYKMKRAMINDLWTQNLHLGNDSDDSTIKITSDAYGVDEVSGVKEVYHEFTRTGIKENGTYLSEKYAPLSVIGDINSILATI